MYMDVPTLHVSSPSYLLWPGCLLDGAVIPLGDKVTRECVQYWCQAGTMVLLPTADDPYCEYMYIYCSGFSLSFVSLLCEKPLNPSPIDSISTVHFFLIEAPQYLNLRAYFYFYFTFNYLVNN